MAAHFALMVRNVQNGNLFTAASQAISNLAFAGHPIYTLCKLLARYEDQDKMRIGIDARFLTHPQPGGFKTYTENLVNALSLIDDANSYVLYLDRTPVDTTLPGKDNFTYRVVPGTLPILGMPIREQIDMPRHIVRDRIAMMHFPSLTATLKSQCPFVLTLHDTIWLTARPSSFSSREGYSPKRWAMWLYNRWVPRLAAQRAQHIVTVSHAAKADIVNQLGISAQKIHVIHNFVKAIFRPVEDKIQIENLCRRYALEKEFILGIGSADPRKNMFGLVSAYAKLPDEQRSRYQLCIIWTHSFLQQELLNLIHQLGIFSQVTFLKDVSDRDLALLYNAATLFVFPSHYEGFGLPLLEAMSCSTPVVAADNSSIPEVVGNAGLLVDATDQNALAETVRRALTDDVLRAELSQRGLKRVKQFSRERFAIETLKVYERVQS